jgi:ferrous iron transport protein B
MRILLVGNPNCGKTTLFNALTGESQRVGNWPGVTVEQKIGQMSVGHVKAALIDLPGIYSLTTSGESTSQDEQITAQAVALADMDCIINVIDACHLERHLYLTSQLLELGVPVVVVLNMIDLATTQGIELHTEALSTRLKCPVIALQAHRGIGISTLKNVLAAPLIPASSLSLPFGSVVEDALRDIQAHLRLVESPRCLTYMTRRIAEGDKLIIPHGVALLFIEQPDVPLDVLMADARYQVIHELVGIVQTKASDVSEQWTAKLDRIVLHRFWAFPLFFAMMYALFFFAIHIGGAFQDFFDITTETIFVQGFAYVLQSMHAPAWLIAWCADGIGRGINTTLTFTPVMASMFFFLSLLESSGYMARAAFVVDKAMRLLGLPGKAFVPMIVGFGCNVPAVLAARTLDSERDRLLTILMSPFMSCSARLAIYAVFVAAFFPQGGQNVVFSLYLIGIAMAVITGMLVRRTLLEGAPSPLILELPVYHKPSLRRLCRDTNTRLRLFLLRAGKLIVPMCAVLGALNACSLQGEWVQEGGMSILSWLGQHATPLFSPMGISQDNWPATVGLLTGILAKEVVVGSLNSLYVSTAHVDVSVLSDFDIWLNFKAAFYSIFENFMQLGQSIIHPIAYSVSSSSVSQSMYGAMVERFDGQVGAYAYLLFVLLYIPCVSTMAVIRQEASRQLMYFSIAWSTLVAYTTAVLFYQFATIKQHPEQSMLWCACLGALLWLFVYFLRGKGHRQESCDVISAS